MGKSLGIKMAKKSSRKDNNFNKLTIKFSKGKTNYQNDFAKKKV